MNLANENANSISGNRYVNSAQKRKKKTKKKKQSTIRLWFLSYTL